MILNVSKSDNLNKNWNIQLTLNEFKIVVEIKIKKSRKWLKQCREETAKNDYGLITLSFRKQNRIRKRIISQVVTSVKTAFVSVITLKNLASKYDFFYWMNIEDSMSVTKKKMFE